MIIIGHKLIPFEPLLKPKTTEDIKTNKHNNTILIDFNNGKLTQYISENISLALHVKNIEEACLANALGAKFIVVNENIAKSIQTLATEYLFDSKIILLANSENDIEKAAKDFIDGILLPKGVVSA